MIDMDEEKEVVSHKWADRVAIALLICLLVVLIVTGVHVLKAQGAEDRPAVNLVLQFDTADGGILKGLISHYLNNDHLIEIREDAKYTVIILSLKKNIYQGLFGGFPPFMFISGIVLGQQDHVITGFANVCEWQADVDKMMGAKKASDAIATIISKLPKGGKL